MKRTMPSEKKQTSFYQENERLLSGFFISKKKFLADCKEHFCETAKAKDFYFHVLTKVREAVIENKVDVFQRLCNVVECMNDAGILNKEFLSDQGHPLVGTDLIILSCKYNRPEILKYLFYSSCKVLSILSLTEIGVTYPDNVDAEQHNAFYYAIRSSSINLLSTLIDQWPGIHFSTNPQKLDELLSKTYEELKLKKVFLSEEIEIFVESKLLDLHFFSENSVKVKHTENDINKIKERIKLVIEKIQFLKGAYFHADVDEIFLLNAKFIAQNIHILKRQLKSTYRRLPWEEIEFCLICFVLSCVTIHEMNLLFNVHLTKSSILHHLENFAKKLGNEVFPINVNVQELAILPNEQRDKITAQIVQNSPEFSELYDAYKNLRDFCSLEKIKIHLKLATSANPNVREGQLIIIRTLQVIGEYFKNTLESPKLSKTTSELLLSSLPRDTRKVIIDLRNALSHSNSFYRSKIGEKGDVSFFSGIQNDAKIIENLVSDILLGNKIDCIESLIKKVTSAESIDELRATTKTFHNLNFNFIEPKYPDVLKEEMLQKILKPEFSGMTKEKKLEKMVADLNQKVTDPTDKEKILLREIKVKMESVKTRSEEIGFNYSFAVSSVPTLFHRLHDESMNPNSFRTLKFHAKQLLEKITSKIKPLDLKDIIERSVIICASVSSRREDERLNDISKLMHQFFHFAELETNDMKWIEKLREQLSKKSSIFFTDMQESTLKEADFLKDSDKLKLKLNELRDILNSNGFGGESIGRLTRFSKEEEIQPVIEMLVLDIMSILGNSKKLLEKNIFFLDDHIPLLTGKCLRDHLAHGNALVDLLSHDPAVAVILNAKKLISLEDVINSNKKVGKFVRDSPSCVKMKHDRKLVIISNQEKMFSALAAGNLQLLKTCLEEGADINARNIKGQTAIHLAAISSNMEVLKVTISQILNLNLRDIECQTPVHIAAEHGNSSSLEFLFKKTNLQVDDMNASLKTPLHLAAQNGHKEAVKVLLKNKASTSRKDAGGSAALHFAVLNNHIDVVKILLEKEANADSNQTSGGYTSLHIATEYGYLDLVNFLLLKHANPNAATDSGRVPLHSTALNGHLKVLQALIQNGADVNVRVVDGCTPLHYAVETGREEVTRVLLEHGANPNIFDKAYGNRPLHYAAQDGREGITNVLLENGANANAPTLTGDTPLHFAAQNGHLKIVAALLKHGVDIHAKNHFNSVPLLLAAAQGHLEIVKLLIKNGADVNMENTGCLPPLHAAAMEDHTHIIEFLIKNKAKVNAKDVHGSTALLMAATKGKLDAIRVLLKNRAEVNTENNYGTTPIQAALAYGCKDSVQLLIENNADVNKNSKYGAPLLSAIAESHEQVVKFMLEKKDQEHSRILKDGSAMYLAIQGNNKKIVELLIGYGADVNNSKSEFTPLISAVKFNKVEIVELLLTYGACVNENKGEPLSLAVFLGFKDIIETLLKNGAHIHYKYAENITLLHLAAKKGDERTVNALINKGAEINVLSDRNETPLFLASSEGHEEVVKILIANKADVNITSTYGTPLHFAVGRKHIKVVEILLDNGAKVETRDDKNRTSLELAIAHGSLLITKMLFKQSEGNINTRGNDGWTVLHIAAQGENLEIVKFLVDNGADINAKNNSGSKPIHIAAREGRKNILEYFLSKGLSVHEIGAAGQTPLHYAAMNGQLEVIKYLLTQGTDVNYKDYNGSGPIHMAASHSSQETVKLLLKYGALYSAVNRFGVKVKPSEMTQDKGVLSLSTSTESLFESVRQNDVVQVRKFIKAGAFVDVKHPKYGTPLHYAVWKGFNDIIDCLLENDANPNIVVVKGFTPLHYAAKYSQFKAVVALLQKGAIYDCVSDSKQTPLEFSKDKKIIELLETVNQAFSNVKISNVRVINDLNKITDKNIVKAVMRARCEKNHTVVVAAMLNNFPRVDQLKQIFQGNASVENAMNLMSVSMLRSILDIRKDILGEDNPGTLDVHVSLAKLHYAGGNYSEAYNILNVVSKKFVEILGINNKDALHAKSTFALVLHRMEKNQEAFYIFEEIYPMQKKLLGPNHNDVLDSLFHMALVMERLGKYEEALSINTELFEKRKKLLGENNLQTIRSRNNMALVLRSQGKLEEALKIFREVFVKKKLVLGIQDRDTLRTYRNIAHILSEQKKSHEALKIFEEILDIQKNFLGHGLNHPDNLHIKFAIANELFQQGKCMNSLKVFKELYELGKVFHGADNQFVSASKEKMRLINELILKPRGSNISEALEHLQKDIFTAANDGDLKTVQNLLKDGVDINGSDADGRSPLHFAISNGHTSIVKFLLDNKADSSQITNKGNTPLHTAAAKGQKAIVEMLLQHVSREKLNHLINFGTTASMTTALHVAAKNGSLVIVKSLLKNGAMYDVRNKNLQTPLDVANDQSVIMFLKLTEDLFSYAKRGTSEMIEKLKSVSSEDFSTVTNARNNQGNTMLTVAIVNKHKHLVDQLLSLLKQQK